MTELQMQAKCYEWYWNKYRHTKWKLMLHNNDNNSYNRIEGNRKKALGVVKGISDFELLAHGGQTWYIELKIPGGTQSEEQKEFMRAATSLGHLYRIIYSFEEFTKFITEVIGE